MYVVFVVGSKKLCGSSAITVFPAAVFVLVVLLLGLSLAGAQCPPPKPNTSDTYTIGPTDPYCDFYGDVSREHEIFHVIKFGVMLKNQPVMTAYIAYNWSNEKEHVEMRKRAERASKYLLKKYKLPKERIVVVEGRASDKPLIILQTAEKGALTPRQKGVAK